jgi:hypothetical protein
MKRLLSPTLIGVCLVVAVQVTLAGARLLSPPATNPLAPYDAIRPGLPGRFLSAYDCKLLHYFKAADVGSYICEIRPESEVIEGITVSVIKAGFAASLFGFVGCG